MKPDIVTSSNLSAAGEQLRDKIRPLVGLISDAPVQTCYRIEVPLAEVDPLLWLANQPDTQKLYFRSRPNGARQYETAAIGIADQIKRDRAPIHFAEITRLIARQLHNAPESCHYYGGIQFHALQDHIDSSFRDSFGVVNLVLPRFEIVRDDSGTTLACNIVRDEIDNHDAVASLFDQLDQLVLSDQHQFDEIPTIVGRLDLPDKKSWCQRVEQCVGAIDEYELDKIVLARQSTFTFTRALSPWQLLDGFRKKKYPRFLFGFQPDRQNAFISTTPELLFSREGSKLHSEALAGTRPRSGNLAEDNLLAEQLLKSKKERREHAFVENQVCANLEELCQEGVRRTEVDLARLEHVQHLVARFEGELRDQIGDAELLTALHPTPAVGGSPREKAVDLIRTLETFDRGWYAGPIGWIGARSSLFAVGIRSGAITNNRLTLYSGAGIVEGSLPIREWAEIENKIQGFLTLLTRA